MKEENQKKNNISVETNNKVRIIQKYAQIQSFYQFLIKHN